jgi:hydroxypyruvate isomerase
MIFNDSDYVSRLKKVREAGMDAYEFWAWWGKDLEALDAANKELGLTIATFCTKFVTLIDPDMRQEYISGLKESIAAAKRVGVKQLISQTGNERIGVPREHQHRSLVEGLKACAPILEGEGITLLVEPLNLLVNHKGYYLATSDESFAVIDEVGSANVKILFDIYHQQITEGNLIRNITNNIDKIGHFHVADNPGRNEPGTGEINYPNVFKAIEAAGYKGFVGLEYSPIKDAVVTLKSLLAMV